MGNCVTGVATDEALPTIVVVGLGYVGLPLLRAFWQAGFPVLVYAQDDVARRIGAPGDRLHPLLARLYAARGVLGKEELDDALARLLPPAGLKGVQDAAKAEADRYAAQQRGIQAEIDRRAAEAKALETPAAEPEKVEATEPAPLATDTSRSSLDPPNNTAIRMVTRC